MEAPLAVCVVGTRFECMGAFMLTTAAAAAAEGVEPLLDTETTDALKRETLRECAEL